MYLCKYLWSMFKMQDICKFTLDICIQISKNAIFVEIWKLESHWEVESTSDGGSRMRLRIVASGFKSTDWQVGNGEIPLPLNALGCLGEVDQLDEYEFCLQGEKLLWRPTRPSNASHCWDNWEPLLAHLPAWVTQDLLSIRLSKLATHSNINFCLLTTSSVDGTTQ